MKGEAELFLFVGNTYSCLQKKLESAKNLLLSINKFNKVAWLCINYNLFKNEIKKLREFHLNATKAAKEKNNLG